MNPLIMIFAGLAGMSIFMSVLYFIARRIKDNGIVDAGWATGIAALAFFYAFFGDGLPERRLLLAVLGGIWGLRLGLFLFFNRVLGKVEDGRYKSLREEWGDRAPRKFFIFFQWQASWSVLFSLPFIGVVYNSSPDLGLFDYIGVIIWLIAVGGETLADRQLAGFRSDPGSKGKVCNVGLWRYSRHPNYFFEWIHWFAYISLSIGSAYWWISLLGPLTMGIFLFKITGIPYTEEQALRSRGDAYREYQKTTSKFIPWFPKK